MNRSPGPENGPYRQWEKQREERIQQHRKRIADEMRRIKKAGLMLNKVPVRDILEAGVELSDELHLTQSALMRLATNN